MHRAIFGRNPSEVREQRNDFESLRRIQTISTGTREATRTVFDGTLQQAVEAAKNRHGKTPEQYHRDIVFTAPEQPEQPAVGTFRGPGIEDGQRHYCRTHLLTDGKKHPMIFVIGGNKEKLYDPNPGDPRNLVYGSRHVFESLAATGKFHVVQLKVGDVLSGKALLNPSVARAHIDNVVHDALTKQGMFAGCDVSEVRFFGYSYGADTARQVASDTQTVPSGMPVTRMAFVDAIRARTVLPPRAMRLAGDRPAAYYNVFQRNGLIIAGGPLEGRGSAHAEDQNVDLTKANINGKWVNHLTLTNTQVPAVRKQVYKPLFEFLAKEAA